MFIDTAFYIESHRNTPRNKYTPHNNSYHKTHSTHQFKFQALNTFNTFVIHNASRPCRPQLLIRVLGCPWEVFCKQGEYDFGSIGIWSQIGAYVNF